METFDLYYYHEDLPSGDYQSRSVYLEKKGKKEFVLHTVISWGGWGSNQGNSDAFPIPDEWFRQPYDIFLDKLEELDPMCLPKKILIDKAGLKDFLGFTGG